MMLALRAPQDTSARASDSAAALQPPMRTPQNIGYMQAAYTIASLIYVFYLVVLYRRWSALRSRAPGSGR